MGQIGTEEAKQSGIHRRDTKGANPQIWAEDLLFREFSLVGEERFLFEVKK